MEKSVPPTTVIEFLGITFDLIRFLLILPQEKLDCIVDELQIWENREWASRKQLQSLAGKLQFTSLCVRLGRVFVSRLYDRIAQIEEGQIVRLNEDIKKDLFWWTVFLDRYNGVSFMWLDQVEGEMAFATDATLSGIGGFYKDEFFSEEIEDVRILQGSKNIAHMEMLALTIALKIWIVQLKMKRLIIECDNIAVLEVINRGKAKDKLLQKFLREIAYITANYQCQIKIKYIKSELNLIPDMLSRYHTDAEKRMEFDRLHNNNPRRRRQKITQSQYQFLHDW